MSPDAARPGGVEATVPRRILVAGATGYLGSRLVPRLVARGHAVRALVRGGAPRAARVPHLAGCEVAPGSLDDAGSCHAAARGMDTVIHLAGILREAAGQTFEGVHVEGTTVLVQMARHAHCRRFLYVSAIGARLDAPTAYWRTKAVAENLVRDSGLEWLVLRPSIVLARDGEFHTILRQLTAVPLVPVLGPGTSRMAPVLAADLAEVEVRAMDLPAVWNRTWTVCGPRAYTFNELLRASARGRPLLLVHLPLPLVRPLVALGHRVLPFLPITPGQLAMLEEDSVCDPAPVAAAFGVTPGPCEPVLAGAPGTA